jgi:hypothetical protein
MDMRVSVCTWQVIAEQCMAQQSSEQVTADILIMVMIRSVHACMDIIQVKESRYRSRGHVGLNLSRS